MWYDWAIHFSVIESIPVDVLEPGMRFDGLCSAFDVTEAFRGVDCAEAGDQIAGCGGHG